jgi:hypothetical protein
MGWGAKKCLVEQGGDGKETHWFCEPCAYEILGIWQQQPVVRQSYSRKILERFDCLRGFMVHNGPQNNGWHCGFYKGHRNGVTHRVMNELRTTIKEDKKLVGGDGQTFWIWVGDAPELETWGADPIAQLGYDKPSSLVVYRATK